MPVTAIPAPPEPTVEDLDSIIDQLKASWTARVTVRRQSKEDAGIRDIYVSLDDGRSAVVTQYDNPGFRPGDRVAIRRDHLVMMR